MVIAWNFERRGAGDLLRLCYYRSAKRWRGSCVKKILPMGNRGGDTAARWCSPTERGDGREDGAAWRSAAIAPNRPRTANDSRTSDDTLTNSRRPTAAGVQQHGRASLDRLRCQRDAPRSWNDGTNLPAHIR